MLFSAQTNKLQLQPSISLKSCRKMAPLGGKRNVSVNFREQEAEEKEAPEKLFVDAQRKPNTPMYASEDFMKELSHVDFPKESMSASFALSKLEDTLLFDGNPRLNLATFVSTYAEPEAAEIERRTMAVNHADLVLYPSARDSEQRCLLMLMSLLHHPMNPCDMSPEEKSLIGQATSGSSEAVTMALLAMKLNHRDRMRERNGSKPVRPNLVCGANAHAAVSKFCKFFEVEQRALPVSKDKPYFDPELFDQRAHELVDENTIGLALVLGSTYTGHFDPVHRIARVLQRVNEQKGLHVPIHVDAASGGFVAPFVFPEERWDFQEPLVQSINLSGHKYGQVLPGVGWLLMRHPSLVNKDLVSHMSYMGEIQTNWSVVFSKPAGPIYSQYFQFVRLGLEGFEAVITACFQVVERIEAGLRESGRFEVLSAPTGHPRIPIVVFRLKDHNKEEKGYDEYDLSHALHERDGWIVPPYHLTDSDNTLMLRCCIRQGMTLDMAEQLLQDLHSTLDKLESPHGGRLHAIPEHAEKLKACHPGGQ